MTMPLICRTVGANLLDVFFGGNEDGAIAVPSSKVLISSKNKGYAFGIKSQKRDGGHFRGKNNK